ARSPTRHVPGKMLWRKMGRLGKPALVPAGSCPFHLKTKFRRLEPAALQMPDSGAFPDVAGGFVTVATGRRPGDPCLLFGNGRAEDWRRRRRAIALSNKRRPSWAPGLG